MKFYIHCEEPEFTMVIRWDDDSQQTVAVLKQIFLDNFMKKFKDKPPTDNIKNLQIFQGKKKFSDEDVVVKKIKHMADIYACWIPAATTLKTETLSVKEEKHTLKVEKPTTSQNVDSYLKAGRPEKALNYVKRAQKIHPGNRELIFKECKCYLDLGEADKSLEEILHYCKDMRQLGGVNTARKHEAQVMLAKAYQMKGQMDMAITMLQVPQRKKMPWLFY